MDNAIKSNREIILEFEAPDKDVGGGILLAGGDVEFANNVEVKRVELSEAELEAMGYKTVEDYLRADLHNSQGANGGYNTGVNAKTSLNVGLSHAGREAFRQARKKAVADYYAGRLIGWLSEVK